MFPSSASQPESSQTTPGALAPSWTSRRSIAATEPAHRQGPSPTTALPPASQRCHTREYEIVAVPVQVPSDSVSVCPSRAVPVIDGAFWLTGGDAVTNPGLQDSEREKALKAAGLSE